MASIEKRRRTMKDGTVGPVHYRVRYRDAAGKQRSETVQRLEDARNLVTSKESATARGEVIDPALARMTFTETAADWLEVRSYRRKTTLSRDRVVLKTHIEPVIGDIALRKIRPAHIRAVVDRMKVRGLAPKTIATNYAVLRAVFSWAVADERLGRSPCRGIELPDARRTPKRLASADDIVRLVDAMPAQYRVAVLLGVMGLRLAEVLGLRVGSIDFLRRTVTVRETINMVDGEFVAGDGKTESSQRTIKLPRSVVVELSAHLARTDRTEPGDLVVQAPGGGPVRASNFRNRVYNPALERLDLQGLTFHRLRHSAGHLMREQGVPLEVIQQRLGHRSIRTTADVYGTLPESVDAKVADTLDELLTGGVPNVAHDDEAETGSE